MSGFSGKYRLDARLGGGGMAEVFVGSMVGIEGFTRRCAIKRVLPGFSDNPAFAQMFIAEAQISSRLVHPNIVSVLDFDRDADQHLFLVMELVEGRDLDALVATGPLPLPVIIFVIGEVLRGLGYAHDLPVGTDVRGVVHRDVSPHNVLLSWEGAVKVSDFGIAKARAASAATASVFIKGKPAYMSPEQANGEPLDGRSDLFAVGVMLWEMLVGRRLFVGEDTRATLAAVLFGQIPRPRSLRGDVPKDLERVAMKLLERDLPARYPTAEAALRDLLECGDAPKAGRELLIQLMAERFPGEAQVRQSIARSRGGQSAPPLAGPHAVTAADGAAGRGAMASVGAARAAPTGGAASELSAAPEPRRGRMIALVALAFVATAAAAFGVVTAVTSGKKAPPAVAQPVGSESGSGSGSGPGPGTGSGTQPVVKQPTIQDAGVAVTSHAALPDAAVAVAKKDASSTRSAHPGAEKRTGILYVTALPALRVIVDHTTYGDTPQTITLEVGPHRVELVNQENGYDETKTVTIIANKTTTINRVK